MKLRILCLLVCKYPVEREIVSYLNAIFGIFYLVRLIQSIRNTQRNLSTQTWNDITKNMSEILLTKFTWSTDICRRMLLAFIPSNFSLSRAGPLTKYKLHVVQMKKYIICNKCWWVFRLCYKKRHLYSQTWVLNEFVVDIKHFHPKCHYLFSVYRIILHLRTRNYIILLELRYLTLITA
jgi:hypothetical protein